VDYDVAIIGGGPTGSTCGSLLKKYDPSLRVVILERESFPRDHVGESQLPMIGPILDEMGCWDKIEAANFPIKIGATYRWGRTDDLWDFEFLPGASFDDAPRPGRFEGQRVQTAWQVDRAVYDDILLRHAEELGVEVREETKVQKVLSSGDRIDGLQLATGEVVKAQYYVDGSGSAGVLRRAMGVEIESPTLLRNIAIWDYWQNAEWAVKIGVGGTRVQVMSLGYGWIWFIPLSPTRTSVGLVTSADYYKKCGLRPAELYAKALAEEPRISDLLRRATSEDKLATTKDWSFWSERAYGENWFLAGEALGFADPILAAGMTLAHTGAREAAYTILELNRGELDDAWLKERYEENQINRIKAHLKFAEFWYSANGVFTDIKEYTSEIARESGLTLSADEAFRWLSTGGFTHDDYRMAQIGTWDVTSIKLMAQRFTGEEANWEVGQNNVFELDLVGTTSESLPAMENGRIFKVRAYSRGGKRLPNVGYYRDVIKVLLSERTAMGFSKALQALYRQRGQNLQVCFPAALQALEAMIAEGWVKASYDPGLQSMPVRTPEETSCVHANRDAPVVAAS